MSLEIMMLMMLLLLEVLRMGRVNFCRDKRGGVFMAIPIVLLTLVLCGMVLLSYSNHQNKLSIALVSPLAVLEIRDELDIFEMREKELVLDSVEKSGIDKEKFEKEFVSGLSQEMKDFILKDLFWRGSKVEVGTGFDENGFFRDVLYSVEEVSDGLVLKRQETGKRGLLKVSEDVKIGFPVEYDFVFDREYLITRKNGKYVVEVLK